VEQVLVRDERATKAKAKVTLEGGQRLSDPAVARQLTAEIAAMRARPALAREFLLETGIITPKTGKLTKRYGG
jgi:hypothetical protein